MTHVKPDLKVDWCTYEAAKYACEHWHYSRIYPMGKDTKIGVWENGAFIGVVLFRNGALSLGSPYGLIHGEVCELARIALREHASFVSQIIAISIKKLKKLSPNLKLIVSFADPYQNHHGGIYQATNWIYTGESSNTTEYFYSGKWYHPRSFKSSEWSSVSGIDTKILKQRKKPGKHRYLMPLTKKMRKQILPLSKPYPKRSKQAMTGTTGTATEHHRSERSIMNRAG